MSNPRRTPRLSYGWYVLAASFVILFLTAGAFSIIGVMIKPMASDLGWSRSVISGAIFLNMSVYGFSAVLAGRLYDRVGPRWVVAPCSVLFATGFLLMATMHSKWQFFLYYGVLSAAGFGGTTIVMFGSIIRKWFDRWRGLAASLGAAGYCLGQFILIPIYGDMIAVSGWRRTSVWIALICLTVNLMLLFAVIRDNPARSRKAVQVGFDRGTAAPEPSPLLAVEGDDAKTPDLTFGEALRTRSLWLFATTMFVCGGGDLLLTTHLVPMVTDYGLSAGVGANMLAWVGLVSLVGILAAGPAADAIGNKIPIAVTFALRMVLFLLIIWWKGKMPFWIYTVGIGSTLLVTAVLTPTLVSALYGLKHIGTISGFIVTIHCLGGGLWSYLGGLIFDKTGDYDLAYFLAAAAATVALFCTLLIQERRHVPHRSELQGQVVPAES